jgi:hypothetical protein
MFFRLRGRGKLPETRFSGIAVNDVDFALATKFWPIFQNATLDLASKHWTQRHRSWLAELAVRRHRDGFSLGSHHPHSEIRWPPSRASEQKIGLFWPEYAQHTGAGVRTAQVARGPSYRGEVLRE